MVGLTLDDLPGWLLWLLTTVMFLAVMVSFTTNDPLIGALALYWMIRGTLALNRRLAPDDKADRE